MSHFRRTSALARQGGLVRPSPKGVAGLVRRQCGGFTLIELLVVISLLTIVVGLLTYPLMAGFTFLSKGKARHEANSATRSAMSVMVRELSGAIDVITVREANGRVKENVIVFVLPAMRTHCPGGGGHWLTDAQGRDFYSYYCRQHLTANVEHELIEPIVPMRNAKGERVAIIYCRQSGGAGAGEYVARAVVPFPRVAAPDELLDWAKWKEQLDSASPGSLTPTGENFEIASLRFAPTAVENEVLTPYQRGGQPDYSIYLARYPLWKPNNLKIGDVNFRVEVRGPTGAVVPGVNMDADVRSGTVSFAQEGSIISARAAYLPDRPLMPPALSVRVPIVRGTEVVLGPPYRSPFVRTAVVSGDRPPVLDHPAPGEYWVDYDTGLIYVNADPYLQGNPPPNFTVRFMRQQIGSGCSVMASYQTYALLNIDLTVRKKEAESGKAGAEGVLGLHHDFHVSGKVKLVNVAR